MGIVAIATTAIGAGLSIYQGIQQNAASRAQAQTTRSYSDMQQFEANREAQRIEEDGNRFAQKQKLMYIGSGVEYGGSAVVTITQTKKWAAAEASAKRARGAALSTYGYQTARIQEGQGRAALVGGFASAAGKIYSYGDAKGWGWGSSSSGSVTAGRDVNAFLGAR